MPSQFGPRPWMKRVLQAAGIYNLLWGLVVVLFPAATLRWAGLSTPVDYPQLWQCIGMIVGTYGVGYLIAAANPLRHWPIVCVGLLGKVCGPIGFAGGLLAGTLPPAMTWTILTNDLIWWIPFTMILWHAYRDHEAARSVHAQEFPIDDPVHELPGSTGQSLWELSMQQPQLVVFLRHAGCTFCREAMADLERQRDAIADSGAGLVLVHLGADQQTIDLLDKHDLGDVPRFSDPTGRLYRQFGLEMGRFRQLFGLKVFLRGLHAAIFGRHGLGRIAGNPFQMPGAFVIHCGRVLHGHQHDSAADRPDYLQFVREALPVAESAARSSNS